MTINIALLALFVAIQIADCWTTWRGFQLGGEEAMPFGRAMFEKLGFWPACLAIKGTFTAVAALVTIYVSNAYWFTGGLDIMGLAVLANNVRFIIRKSEAGRS